VRGKVKTASAFIKTMTAFDKTKAAFDKTQAMIWLFLSIQVCDLPLETFSASCCRTLVEFR
ncbi:MAG: hypothetical protein IJ067_10715, partial [Prevotella sp.]|nr:hypothetical protein [Prevotella sp.]